MVKIPNLNKLALVGLLYIAVMNTLSIFIIGASLGYLLSYVLPFPIVAVIILALPKYYKGICSSLLFILGIVMSVSGGVGNFSGIMFIIFAIHLKPQRNRTIVRLILIAVAVGVKSLMIDVSHIQIMNLLFMHYYCLAMYYVLMTEKKVVTIREIEDQTEQIMKYVTEGKRNKEIAALTFMSEAAVHKRIKRLMIKEGCETLPQLVYKLYGNGQTNKKIDRFKVI